MSDTRDNAIALMERVNVALENLELAARRAVRALPAGHAFLGDIERVLQDARVVQRKAEQAVARVR